MENDPKNMENDPKNIKTSLSIINEPFQNSISIIEKCISIAYGIGFFIELAYVIGDFFI